MSSETESSDGENFDGFDPEEAQDAENNFLAMLRHQGIGDDAVSDVSEVETDVDDAEVELGPGGAADDQDEWHAGFDYFERGLPHIFTPRRNTGPTRSMPPDKEPIDFLALFLDQVLIDLLLEETGRYAQQQIDTNPEQNKQPWKDVSAAEMKAFLGLCMAMGVTRKPSVKLYWSTDSYSETPLFARTMTRDRFSQILRYLHFADNDLEQERNSPTYDPLFKIRTLVSHLNENFVQEYVLRRRVTVDECMVPFKGKVHFKQYMRLKPQKWGVKVWVLAESDCSYVSYIDIYPGRYHHAEGALASRVVKKCLQGAGIQGQGYHVYMDNFYTSPDLLSSLFNEKTYACGTVRSNRRGLPRDIMQKRPDGIVQRGDMAFRQNGPLVAVVWKDKKCVTALSTIHDETATEVQRIIKQEDGTFARENVPCPKLIADYTSHMGGVDKADQYLQYYSFNHKTRKWTVKVFFRLLEIMKLNAYQLFLQSPHHLPGQGKQQLSFLQFTQSIIKGLVGGFTSGARKGRPSLLPLADRLTQRHLPGTLPSRSWCHVCYMRCKSGQQDKASQTKFGCTDCRKHLCLPTCFSVYHSQAKYF